jgi:ADP-ribosyl-[dinitrogen reductase] hydrolase
MTDLTDRVAGSLLGVAVGDALGAPAEFKSADAVLNEYGVLREFVGGGMFCWRPGGGTDDSDMTAAVLDAYLAGYSLDKVARGFLAWIDRRPKDVGGTTAAALHELREHGNPTESGQAVWHEWAAGNGSLMRCLPTGLVRTDPEQRRRDAAEISAITHSDPRCIDACVAYCDLVALLLDGVEAAQAVETVAAGAGLHPEVLAALTEALRGPLGHLNPSTYVVDTFRVAVAALVQPGSFEDILIRAVNLGGDADSTAATAGGLLGARDGINAIPERWLAQLEYRPRFTDAVHPILDLRSEPDAGESRAG